MGRMLIKATLGVGAMMTMFGATAALGQERAVRMSQAAIVDGKLAQAEKTLLAERRIYPDRPEVLLNLAAVYARSGRSGDAVALYRQVLAGGDVLMDLPSGKTASAHAIAQMGLTRLSPTVATR